MVYNDQLPTTNAQQNHNNQAPMTKKFDLGDRTTMFSKRIVDLCKNIEQNIISKPLISQLIRAGTSVGANYSEADEACSKKDFVNKMYIAKKEAKETRYWLEVILHTLPAYKIQTEYLLKESHELILIFAAIINKTRNPFGH